MRTNWGNVEPRTYFALLRGRSIRARDDRRAFPRRRVARNLVSAHAGTASRSRDSMRALPRSRHVQQPEPPSG